MGSVYIRHSIREIATQSSQSVEGAGWQAKMASIEPWIQWRNAHDTHWCRFARQILNVHDWPELSLRRSTIVHLIHVVEFKSISDLKGGVSRYSVIFCASFARAKNGGCSRKCRGHQIRKAWPSAPRGLAAWPPSLAADMTVPWTNDKSSQSWLLHLSTATGSTFAFRLRGPSKVISPSSTSRFKIRSDSYIDIDSLFGCLVLRAFRSLLRRSRRRENGWLGEGIGSVVVAPFPVTLTMCVTVKANALNEERVRGTDVDVRANTGFLVAFAQYRRDKDLKTQETHLW